MKFDVIIFEGDRLADYAEPDTPAIRLNDVSEEKLGVLMELAARQKHLFVCCLPYPDEA